MMRKYPKLWGSIVLLLVVLAWKGQQWLAFERGAMIYMFGYPLVVSDMTEGFTIAPEAIAAHRPGAAPINHLAHMRTYPDPGFNLVTAPNSDTLYESAYLDLSQGPMLLHMPDMQGRWVEMALIDGWANMFASLGTRNHGFGEKTYAIVGPGWTGTLPTDVVRVDSPTSLVWLIGRTYTAGEADFNAVHKIQDQYVLRPLSPAGTADSVPADSVTPTRHMNIDTPVIDQVAAFSTSDFFGRLARLMTNNPPAPADAPMVASLAAFGIEAGKPFDIDALSTAKRRGLEAGIWFVKALFDVRMPGSQGDLGLGPRGHVFFKDISRLMERLMLNFRNNWMIPLNLGTYGTNYPLRAIVTEFAYGLNVAQDAIYPNTMVDADGKALNGTHSYVVHFDKGQLPPAKVFWSLSIYNDNYWLVENRLKRHALGDRDPLQFNADGSLDFFVQKEPPDAAKLSNWLPAPAGDFKLVIRIYGPSPDVLDGNWAPRPVRRVAAN